MNRRFSFFITAAAIVQLLTAVFHSLSFFVKPEAKNDTEKQLIELSTHYHPDAGMGFHPSLRELFTGLSICFTLICLFAALLNLFFKKKNLAVPLWRGFLLIQTVIFAMLFTAMAVFTFLPPIVCTGLIFILCLGAYLTAKQNLSNE
jgi:NO-binding membrane sensor protein with MHYT domain